MLAGRVRYSVLGLGDSNLLLDRQTTSAKDCNQVAQMLDARLGALGADCFYARGEVDDRTGNVELQPWVDGLWAPLGQTLQALAGGALSARELSAGSSRRWRVWRGEGGRRG